MNFHDHLLWFVIACFALAFLCIILRASIPKERPWDDKDSRIARYECRKGGILARLIRRLTSWAWKPIVRAPMNRMHERGLIDSHTLHEAHAFTTKLMCLILFVAMLSLAGCASFLGHVSQLKTDLKALVSNPSSAVNQLAVSNDVTAITGDAQTAYNSLSGIATVYQAYVNTGLSVPTKVASAAASVTSVGRATQAVLSKVTAVQSVANGLFAAAANLAPSTVP